MSAAQELPLKKGKVYTNTGVFLSEFYLAYADLAEQGYSVDFATPGGRVAKMDKESYDKKYWKGRDSLIEKATLFVQENKAFNRPLPLETALNRAGEYDGMIIPGGQVVLGQ